MESILETCKRIFDRSPRPFGISKVHLDDEGNACDVTIEYLNKPMAASVQCDPEDLCGKNVYEIWPDGNKDWLEYYYKAAYCNEAVEFETVDIEYMSFNSVTIFPLVEGYCAYEILDVMSWLATVHPALKNISAGVFFYEYKTAIMMLSEAAQICFDITDNYIGLDDFLKRCFDERAAAHVKEAFSMKLVDQGDDIVEAKMGNGKWVRLGLTQASPSSKFAIGFVEDISLLHEYADKSSKRSKIIESLSSEYYGLYVVSLDDDTISPYLLRTEDDPLSSASRDLVEYTSWLESYCSELISEEDRPKVLAQLSRDALLRSLAEGSGEFSISCRRNFGDRERFIELRVARIGSGSDEVVIAARNINDEVESQILQKDALQSALDLAEHASDAKTNFLTNVSHDFRTPLNSIMGFTQIALGHLDDREVVEDSLGKIQFSSEHLLDLINEILDVSRIESGSMILDDDPLDIRQLLDEIHSIFQAQAIENGIILSLDTSRLRHTAVLGDQLRLKQVLVNIIGNSLKYTSKGGKVEIVASEKANLTQGAVMFKILVRDNGCGMSDDFVQRIFIPFERDASNDASSVEGTGLGMTITKNIVDLMGGTITVRSKKGEGTEFAILLPLKLDSSVSDDSAKAYEHEWSDDIDLDGVRILVVDDDDLSREMVSMILSERGAKVEQASDGEQAVAAVRDSEEGRFDAIIMDMRMPRMPGDEATRAIRALPREDVAGMPIIAATADAYEEGYRRSVEAGMTAHITKPIRARNLISTLGSHLFA